MYSENRQWLASFINGILLLCLGFYLVSSIMNHASAASEPDPNPPKASVVGVHHVVHTTIASRVPEAQLIAKTFAPQRVLPLSAIPISPPSNPPQPAPTAAAMAASQSPSQPTVREEVKIHTYETTAYYLNVREQPYPKSKILNVLEQGTIIDVLQKTDNGWLKLKSGGYVHGGYARLLKNDIVKIASLSTESSAVIESLDSDSVPNKPTSTVTSESGLSEDDIGEILEDTELADQGLEKAILDIESEYGVNAYFTIAVMKLESGNGESKLAKRKNNLFGLNAIAGDAFNKALSFETKADCIRMFGQLIAEKYVDQGYTTVEKIARKYCPANSKWSSHVKTIMTRDYRSL